MRSWISVAVAGLVVSAVVTDAEHALARRNGISAPDCTGCHGNEGATVQISASPSSFQPNDEVTFTVTIRRGDGTAMVGGMFAAHPTSGPLRVLSGEGLVEEPDSGLIHSQPKSAASGTVTFRFAWRAPSEPGGLVLDISALAANGDNRPSGDQAGHTRYTAAFGCTGVTYYPDLDRDGYGSEVYETSIGCENAPVPEGWATELGDCDQNEPKVHPGAAETCNRVDDDCNGAVDDNSLPVELWPDEDGDGYFGMRTGTPMMGCVGLVGYAALGGDCAPRDPNINPGVKEVCNLIDDNCDGRPDERTRPQCGIGACVRESDTCDVAQCRPGEPKAERCNYFDDDCNGVVDDNVTCPDGGTCIDGKCRAPGTSGGAGGASAMGGANPMAGATTTGGASGTAPVAGSSGGGVGAPPGTLSCSTVPGRPTSPASAWALTLAVLGALALVRKRRPA